MARADLQVFGTSLDGVIVTIPARFADSRGFFSETWSSRAFRAAGIDLDFVQDNQSFSCHAGTIRGLHFQCPPHAQAKLVRVGRGRILDVAVDIRKGSPTWGRWIGVELSAENGRQLLVPAGFAHGFVTREPDTEVLYKCSDGYAPDREGAVRFDDPDLGIDWQVGPGPAVLSDSDREAPMFRDLASPFRYSGPFAWSAGLERLADEEAGP